MSIIPTNSTMLRFICIEIPQNIESNLKICTSLQSQTNNEIIDATRALLRTDDFLMIFLNYLTRTQDVLTVSFLTDWDIISHIVQYSSRNPYIHTLADSFVQSVMMTHMTEADIMIQKFEQARISPPNSVANEMIMIKIVLHSFSKLLSSSEYISWCLRIKIDKNLESQRLRKVVEMM